MSHIHQAAIFCQVCIGYLPPGSFAELHKMGNSLFRSLSTAAVKERVPLDVLRPRLQSALPARLRLRDWKMAYSSKRDGISLRSLYRAASREAGAKNGSSAESLLFVRDSRGNAFGAFATEPWRVHQRYYGTGESFVFTVHDESSSAASEKTADDAKKQNDGVVAFRWSQRNDYFMFGRADCAAVGGGNGFALWLDEELLRGNSAPSETFDNPCLSGGVKDFQIVYVELWTFAARNA